MELIIIFTMATHRHALVGLIIITVIRMMTTHGHAMVGLNEAKSRRALWVCGKLDHLATWEWKI